MKNTPEAQIVKHFVLDTNILLHAPTALFKFDDNHVVIPFAVIEEVDQFKKQNDEVGRNARESIRFLDKLRETGSLMDGVKWNEAGGTIRIEFDDTSSLPSSMANTPDNRIISVAIRLKQNGHHVILVSNDINCRVKSDAFGVLSQDFKCQKVNVDELYTGNSRIVVPGELIDTLYKQKMIDCSDLIEYLSEGEVLFENQYVVFVDSFDESHTGLGRVESGVIHPIGGFKKPVYGIVARNVEQTMALDLLMNDDIKLVTLIGNAGTGKTLLACAAAMTKLNAEEIYEKLLVARPIMPMGKDIGYLPGDKDEKLSVWMQPIFDNLSYLMSNRSSGVGNSPDSFTSEQRIKTLIESGKIVMEPLTYIRGRSIPHQFMIIDEAQNLTAHEVKTIVSRVGEGTKIVLTGDIGQIDNPYLDSASNGLSYVIDRLKGEHSVGHITLTKSERSELASLAANKL